MRAGVVIVDPAAEADFTGIASATSVSSVATNIVGIAGFVAADVANIVVGASRERERDRERETEIMREN